MSIGFGKQKDLAALEGRHVSLDGALTILSFIMKLQATMSALSSQRK